MQPAAISRRPQAFARIAALAAGACLLYRFPPEQSHFYPLCPIYTYTGLLCPGCGATRALAALLHGHLGQAFHFNPLLIVLLPLLALYLAVAIRRECWPVLKPSSVNALLIATVLFTIVRNLNYGPRP